MSLFFLINDFLLEGFLNPARTQTSRTDLDSFDRTVFHNLHALQIGVKLPGSDIMSVRDRIAEHWLLFTYVTLHWHGKYSPHS